MAIEERIELVLEGLVAEALAADSQDTGVFRTLDSGLAELTARLAKCPSATAFVHEARKAIDLAGKGRLADRSGALSTIADALTNLAEHLKTNTLKDSPETDSVAEIVDDVAADLPAEEVEPSEELAEPVADVPTASGAPALAGACGDEDLLNDYVAECLEHISASEMSLLAIESDPTDAEQINTVLRAFHTIKGSSAFLGLTEVQRLAHEAESLLSRARDGEIEMTGENAALAFRVCDALKLMINHVTSPDAAAGTEDLTALTAALSGQASSAPAPINIPVGEPLVESADDPVIVPPAPEEAPAENVEAATSGRSSDATVRVRTERLDDLVDSIGELVIAQSMASQSAPVLADANGELGGLINRVSKIARDLHDTAIALRMIPLSGAFARLARIVRDVAWQSQKPVRFLTEGEETEIDRHIVEGLIDPLVHMIRNAVDHGIEDADGRQKAGKDAAGVVSVRAQHVAGNVQIEIEDDGRGLDIKKIQAKAAASGLIAPGHELTESEAFSLIFNAGFSTAEVVSDVSGRGVGMDVVKRNIERLGGRIEATNEPGRGTTFTLRLPLTLAITDAMLVSVGLETYLLPTIAIERAFRPTAENVSTVTGTGEVVDFDGDLIPIVRLADLFSISDAVTNPADALLLVITARGKRWALQVDELLGHQHTVIKTFEKSFNHTSGTAGGAILHDGRVGLLLDLDAIVQLSQETTSAFVTR